MGGDVIILLRRKGFDPDIAKELRSFEHEEGEKLVANVEEGEWKKEKRRRCFPFRDKLRIWQPACEKSHKAQYKLGLGPRIGMKDIWWIIQS